eukprot:UN34838
MSTHKATHEDKLNEFRRVIAERDKTILELKSQLSDQEIEYEQRIFKLETKYKSQAAAAELAKLFAQFSLYDFENMGAFRKCNLKKLSILPYTSLTKFKTRYFLL